MKCIRLAAYSTSHISIHYLPLHCDYAIYYYSEGGYEGNGQLIFHIPNIPAPLEPTSQQIITSLALPHWYLHDMSHCSCYGPLENIQDSMAQSYISCIDILQSTSLEYQHDIIELVNTTTQYLESLESEIQQHYNQRNFPSHISPLTLSETAWKL